MSTLTNQTIKNSESGFFINGQFNGLTFHVGTPNGYIVRLYPIDIPHREMEIDLTTLTLLDDSGADITPIDIQERSAILNSFVSKKKVSSEGQSVLTAPAITTLVGINTPTKILGVFDDSLQNSREFKTLTSGDLIYSGGFRKFAFFGSGTLSVNIPCDITYRLYRNGTQLGSAFTPLGFQNANTNNVISESRLVSLNNGDVLNVYAESNKIEVQLSVKTLSIVFKS